MPDERLKEFRAALDEYRALLRELVDEFIEWLRVLGVDGNQRHRRAMVRSYFALVEGTIHRMKQFALLGHHLTGFALPCSDVVALEERSYAIDEKGDVGYRDQFVPLAYNIRFTAKVVSRALQQPFEFHYGDEGWQAFRRSIEIRNRLTHPKTAADTMVSDDDIETIKVSSIWFQRETPKLKDAIDAAIDAYINRHRPPDPA
jgi:hypothetical protein